MARMAIKSKKSFKGNRNLKDRVAQRKGVYKAKTKKTSKSFPGL